MKANDHFDVAIAGGGLAGLATAILLRRQGHSVVLFEKETYPCHKVCGEYISLESWNFLQSLGVPLSEWQLPRIDSLLLTAPDGTRFTTRLPLGGFGLSRHLLDSTLAAIARTEGVHVSEGTRVDEIQKEQGLFKLAYRSRETAQGTTTARLCLAAWGKRSNLDVSRQRGFLKRQDQRLDNYVGIKYHVRLSWPEELIGLHNFENGYCGISRIEDGACCLCYMTHASSLKQQGNGIKGLEQHVLARNPHLARILAEAQIDEGFPVTISQINFQPKTRVEEGILMIGDAAGMITPLCGNGMSIALHTAKIAAGLGHRFLQGELSQAALEAEYSRQWRKNFSRRLRTGRWLQRFFGSSRLSNVFIRTFKTFPFLARPLVRMTHGRPF